MENEFKKCIKDLLLLKKNDKFIVNGKYECTVKNSQAFSTFIKDNNCPRYSSCAMVKVAGYDKLAKVEISFNVDLTIDLSCGVCFYENGKTPSSFVVISDIKFL